jgi:hypothetical protein
LVQGLSPLETLFGTHAFRECPRNTPWRSPFRDGLFKSGGYVGLDQLDHGGNDRKRQFFHATGLKF